MQSAGADQMVGSRAILPSSQTPMLVVESKPSSHLRVVVNAHAGLPVGWLLVAWWLLDGCWLLFMMYVSISTSRTSKIEARRLQNRGPEVPKSRSGGSKIEVLGRHGGFLGRLGRLRASREAPERFQEAPRRRLGAVLGPSWGGLEGQEAVFGASWGHLGAI